MFGKKKNSEGILEVTKAEQYRTVDELFERSQPNSVYYTLLVLSSVIIAVGLLLSNSFIVIGGMLVTPMLTPVLMLSLGMVVVRWKPIGRALALFIKSIFAVVLISLILAFAFGAPQSSGVFDNTMRTAILYFLVAVAAGAGGTFAWTRKEVMDVLPGIAIAVSLVPPVSLTGIWLSILNIEAIQFYSLVFLFNLFGVLVGSLVVFTLLKFYKAEKEVEKKEEEVEKKV